MTKATGAEVRLQETWALVSEGGWVHAVFNLKEHADRAAVERSVPLDEVDPSSGHHHYSVVRYAPADSPPPTSDK